MPKGNAEHDATMRAAIGAVGLTALVLTAGALLAFGLRSALGVFIGGAIATVNLVVFARIGRAFLERKGLSAPWVAIALVKFVGLIAAVWLVLQTNIVSTLSLVVGYGALPIGITLGGLFGPKPHDHMLDSAGPTPPAPRPAPPDGDPPAAA